MEQLWNRGGATGRKRTATNLLRAGVERDGVGPTRDVVLVDAFVDRLAATLDDVVLL